jgi:positive regulator of sigma E activity
MKELYHDEVSNLKKFKEKIDAHTIYLEDLNDFSDQYEELIAQAKVITRVSDRLQKKLDSANLQIRDQNKEITKQNLELENTVTQLAQARVGRRASTILYFAAIVLFVIEEFTLDSLLEDLNLPAIIGIIIKVATFLVVKAFEGKLEEYFMNREKEKILKDEYGKEKVKGSIAKK